MKILAFILSLIIAGVVPYMVQGAFVENVPFHILMMWYLMCFTFGFSVGSVGKAIID